MEPRKSPLERRHYLHMENVPLSEAVLEAVDAHERSRWTADGAILDEDIDLEAVNGLFTETLVGSEDVSLSLRMDLPNVHVQVETGEPISIRVTDREGCLSALAGSTPSEGRPRAESGSGSGPAGTTDPRNR